MKSDECSCSVFKSKCFMRSASHVAGILSECFKWCFRENNQLEVFDFEKHDEFSVNMKLPSADENISWRRIFWALSYSAYIWKHNSSIVQFAYFSWLVFLKFLYVLLFCVCINWCGVFRTPVATFRGGLQENRPIGRMRKIRRCETALRGHVLVKASHAMLLAVRRYTTLLK